MEDNKEYMEETIKEIFPQKPKKNNIFNPPEYNLYKYKNGRQFACHFQYLFDKIIIVLLRFKFLGLVCPLLRINFTIRK